MLDIPLQSYPIEYNVDVYPFWGDQNLKIELVTPCSYCASKYCSKYGQTESLRIPNWSGTGTTTETIFYTNPVIIVLIGAVAIVSVSVFVACFLFRRLRNMRNEFSQEEIDFFYDGSDKPSTSVEDVIQNMAVKIEARIPAKSFTYGLAFIIEYVGLVCRWV